MRPSLQQAQQAAKKAQHAASQAATSRWGRAATWVVAAGLLLIAGITLWLNLGLAPTLRKTLQARVSTASNGRYHLDIGRVGINFLTSSVVFKNVAFSPSPQRNQAPDTASQIQLDIQSVRLRDIEWRQYLADKSIELKGIYIESPSVVVKQAASADTGRPGPPPEDALNDLLKTLKQEVRIGEIVLDKGRLVHTATHKQGYVRQSADNIHFAVKDIRLTPGKRAVLPQEIRLSAQHYRHIGTDSLYVFAIRRLELRPDQSVVAEAVSLRPTLSEAAFAQRKRFQADRFVLNIPKVVGRGFDYTQALNRTIALRSVRLQNPSLQVYRDKRRPLRPNHRPPMPNEAMRGLGIGLRIDSTIVSGASITYSELMPQAARPGKITFQKTNLRITNLSNLPRRMNQRTPLVLQGNTQLMANGLLSLTLRTNLLAPRLNGLFKGILREMDVTEFNRISVPSGNVRLKDGTVRQVVFAANLLGNTAKGQLKALYENLEIEVYDPEKPSRNKVLSLLGNLVIRANNQDDDKKPARTAPILYQRESDDSFVRFLWQSVKSGLMTTVTPVNIEKARELAAPKNPDKPPVAKKDSLRK